ncbi:hypothetical protein FSP39_016715 [Pinctada imbricata]|uniref:TIR domain-containing protein n=1 Tax=Pinctada imbricata TaxID=66713 RepID=A0AA89C7V4_PINIB|nr:hypothetical protein FSP39_016715 [Pinctada imbricata]
MAKLRSLKVLLMSGITGKCDIPVLHEKYFQHIEGLENLTITQCGINQIYKDSISKFINLKHFDFSHNKQLSFAVLPNVTFDLNKTDIKNLLFNEIHCTHGLGTEIYLGDFQNIQNADLSLVSANNNRLELIDERIFSRLPFVWNIQYVSLSNNRLSAGKYIYRLVFLSSLKRIDVSYQDRRDDPDADDYNHCDDTINKRQHVQQMRLSENQPKFKRSTNNDKENGVLIPGKLETVYCKYSKQKHEIPEITVLNDNKVKHLHLQGNTFYKWIGPIRNAAKLEYVDLSSNLCSHISPKFLTYVYNLKVLNVSDNVLGYSLQDDTRGKIFKNLKMLKILNLASNKIQILPKLIFHNLDSLEVLNLSLNLLRKIDFEFMHMRKLRIFDISNNQIPSLSRNFQTGLTAMSDHLKVNITNNPLECNCEDIQFWKWLSKSTFVTYSSSQTCWNGKFKDIFDHYNLNVSVEIMEKHCASYIELISVVSSCIFVTFIFILTAIIYRYRWKLRYLYYTTRNNHRGYTNIQRENPNDEFLFDCFVSYADEDRQFAFHDMMKNLEGSNDIKLCFHQRDFIPGFEIGENITNAIHRSRKTICVISSNYLNSHWCKFEFNMARMENIYSRNGNNCLMFILYHPLRSDQIPLDMMYMMESQSYIEYPNEEQERMAFWVKLKDAITI